MDYGGRQDADLIGEAVAATQRAIETRRSR
jgi:hypothetical protein